MRACLIENCEFNNLKQFNTGITVGFIYYDKNGERVDYEYLPTKDIWWRVLDIDKPGAVDVRFDYDNIDCPYCGKKLLSLREEEACKITEL